ncbi:hypothetical protein ACFYOP_04195 [Streptomyces sp. NPDC006294]|uniref:hypothetical protein n=1 Tax=Streptomyces sp. NPDC006294 TaxID=3364743 RepID=UPI0036B6340C
MLQRQFGHRTRLALPPAQALKADGQAQASRTMWNLLRAWWRMVPEEMRTLANADAAIRQARQDIDFLTVLPVGKHANAENRITGARLIKDALGWHITFRIQTLSPSPVPTRGRTGRPLPSPARTARSRSTSADRRRAARAE